MFLQNIHRCVLISACALGFSLGIEQLHGAQHKPVDIQTLLRAPEAISEPVPEQGWQNPNEIDQRWEEGIQYKFSSRWQRRWSSITKFFELKNGAFTSRTDRMGLVLFAVATCSMLAFFIHGWIKQSRKPKHFVKLSHNVST